MKSPTEEVDKILRVYASWSKWRLFAQFGLEDPVPHRPGVYVIRDIRTNQVVYIGMSKNLFRRLWSYRWGTDPHRPPVYQVVRDRVFGNPELALEYLTASTAWQQNQRHIWMNTSGLSVTWAVVEDEQKARTLEKLLIRTFEQLYGHELWNSIKYYTSLPFPPPIQEQAN